MKPQMPKHRFFRIVLSLIVGLLLSSGNAWAQDETTKASSQISEQEMILLLLIGTTILISILVLVTVLYTLLIVRNVVFKEIAPEAEAVSLWKSLDRQLTNAIPLEKEDSILLDHNYDGIRELDNHLPPWWVYLFYGTVAFGILYMVNYHVLNFSPLQEEEYELAMEKAAFEIAEYKKLQANNIDESNVAFVQDDEAALANGKEIFMKNCTPCHGKSGASEGNLTGPNLTDEFWLHGGSIQDVFTTIKYGVPEKGMISWQKQLRPEEMQNVASFILTLQGIDVPNAKAAQGDKYVPEKTEE